MGMDPVSLDETYEVTIILDGPVTRADFKKFRDELTSFLDKFPPNPERPGTPPNPNAPLGPGIPSNHPNKKKPTLQVREGRGGPRKNV